VIAGTADAPSAIMRIALATFMSIHAIAHLVGFFGAWAPTRTTIFGGRIDLGTSWIKLVGICWLLLALTFAGTAAATVIGVHGWLRVAIAVTGASLALCLVQLPETKFGVMMNVVLLAALVLGQRAAWF
jgi:hypothetical protein